MDTFTAEIRLADEGVVCDLYFNDELSEVDASSAISSFRREVLDQDLREQLKKETEQVRNLILAHAFSKTGISSNE